VRKGGGREGSEVAKHSGRKVAIMLLGSQEARK